MMCHVEYIAASCSTLPFLAAPAAVGNRDMVAVWDPSAGRVCRRSSRQDSSLGQEEYAEHGVCVNPPSKGCAVALDRTMGAVSLVRSVAPHEIAVHLHSAWVSRICASVPRPRTA